MPTYKVLYLKDPAAIDRFRSQPPPSGVTSVKMKDYEQVAEIDAPNEYSVWHMLQGESAVQRNLRPMGVGDVLEAEPGRLRVCRFVGFDAAAWFTFEPRKRDESSATAPSEAGETPSETATPDTPSSPPQ